MVRSSSEAGEGEERTGGATQAQAPGDATGRVSFLEQALWKRLGEAASLQEAAVAWLPLQCGMVGGAVGGVVVLPSGDTFAPAAYWPEGRGPAKGLAAAVERAIKERRGVVQGADAAADAAGGSAAIAFPVLVDDTLAGVIGVEIGAGTQSDLRSAMRQLQWGAAWIRDHARKDTAHAKDHVLERTKVALDMVGASLEQEGFAASCQAVTTELAVQCDCSRVSVGFLKRGSCKVAAISHSAQFGKQMNLARLLGAAMDEAIDQRALVLFPQPESDTMLATAAHGTLSRKHDAGHIFTVPFFDKDRHVGAIVFERPVDRPFDQAAIDLLECVANVIGPILQEKRSNDRWIAVKLAESLVEQARRLLGPGYFLRKIVAVAAVAVVAFFWFAKTEYRVTADASIQGTVQRAIIAPYDGFIKDATVRAGDTVEEGQVMAQLDDRDMLLERLRYVTERQKLLFEYDRAVGDRKRAESRIVKAQIEQAEAHIRLIDEQLARATLTAPFAGIVVSGDLSQSFGAAVSRGNVLFEIAPLDSYRVILGVDESQIDEIRTGRTGSLLVSSLPHETFAFSVSKITPVAEPVDGRNTFRVEAQLNEQSPRLRPGMQGIGKIDIEQRRLIWIWSRAMMDWLRAFVWRWMP